MPSTSMQGRTAFSFRACASMLRRFPSSPRILGQCFASIDIASAFQHRIRKCNLMSLASRAVAKEWGTSQANGDGGPYLQQAKAGG